MGGVPIPPDGGSNYTDIFAIVYGFQGISTTPDPWLDMTDGPTGVVNFADILSSVLAFQGKTYFQAEPGAQDPCSCVGQPPCP